MPAAQGGAAVAMPCSRGPQDTSPDTNPPWVHVTTATARWGCRWETGKAQGVRARGASSGELVRKVTGSRKWLCMSWGFQLFHSTSLFFLWTSLTKYKFKHESLRISRWWLQSTNPKAKGPGYLPCSPAHAASPAHKHKFHVQLLGEALRNYLFFPSFCLRCIYYAENLCHYLRLLG